MFLRHTMIDPRLGVFMGAAMLALSACGAPESTAEQQDAIAAPAVPPVCIAPQPVSVNVDRSLSITDQAILDPNVFSFTRVMRQLARTAGSNQTAQDVYHRWWDSQNDLAGAFFANEIHCDDMTSGGQATFNGYPWQCARNEGVFADGSQHDPATQTQFIPIGIFNRFDLAPANGRNCGEARIIFAKDPSDFTPGGTNLVIFEGQIANPKPGCGLEGCRELQNFFGKLSNVSTARRKVGLEQLFFNGIGQFGPVIHWRNFTHGRGQIRTNQFVSGPNSQVWQLREFKTERVCTRPPADVEDADRAPTDADIAPICRLRIVPDTDKTNVFGPLFDPTNTTPEAQIWQSTTDRRGLIAQLPGLIGNDINGLGANIDDLLNSGQSTSQGSGNPLLRDADYPFWFGAGPSTFRTNIQTALTALGSPLSPDDVVKRTQFLSCGGCHQLSVGQQMGGGMIGPGTLGFRHVHESQTMSCDGGAATCFARSNALLNTFEPARKANLDAYLSTPGCPTCP